jgi:hypothetical protein
MNINSISSLDIAGICLVGSIVVVVLVAFIYTMFKVKR